jgi:RNA polymerase-binding transcription factor DksA
MKQPTPDGKLTKLTARSGRSQTPKTMRATGSEALVSSTSPKVPPKWAWHYRVLLKVRERLLGDRSEQLREAAEPLEPHSMDIADSATDEFDHDIALSQLSAEQDALSEIEAALKRIVDSNYGVCEATGQRIPAARLRAIPWTRFCKNVEEDLENKGAVQRAHLEPAHSIRGAGPSRLAETEEAGEEPPESRPKDEVLSRISLPPEKHLHRRYPGKPGRAGGAGGCHEKDL